MNRSFCRIARKTAWGFTGLLLTAVMAQAGSVTISLGATTQSLLLQGTGANGSGLGTYIVTMGACTPSGGSTTCTLSGNYTGTVAPFTSGTYSLVTVYPGTGSSPLLGVQQSAGSNLFQFSSIPAGTTMNLNLTTTTGNFVAPIFSGGQFASGATFGFVFDNSAVCAGTPVSPCSVGTVGLANGSSITGPSTGSATFNAPSTYYYSQVAFQGGYQSTLTLANYSAQAVTCVTNFYGDSGNPLGVPFTQGTVSTRTDVLQPGQAIHDQTVADLSAATAQGWGQSTCTAPVQASMLYRYFVNGVAQGEAGVNGETSATTKFATFAQTVTGVAYANPSTTQTASVTLDVISAAGLHLGSTVINLGPLQHGAANLGPLLGLSAFTGSLEISASSPIISLSLNFEAFPVFSSMPPGDLPSNTVLYLP